MASLHILGICGTFMGGIAAVAREIGYKVSGCDANVYPPMSDQLAELGIDLVEGFGPEQMSIAPDVWVIGNVVSRGNPLMEAILESGQRYISGPQWLYEHVLNQRHVLAVAGTHGKTTTTAMLTHILTEAGLEPGYLVGGVPGTSEAGSKSAAIGGGKVFVIEADEYDTAFFDKRSKFVHYRPRTAILNNLEFDHADIFADLAQIQTQFHHLVRTIPASGLVIYPHDSESLDAVLARGLWSRYETFGAIGSDRNGCSWSIQDYSEQSGGSGFTVYRSGVEQGRCQLELAGEHNRRNALAAIAAAADVDVEPARAVQALNSFGGVRRRLESRGTVAGVTVIDDFAHHPTAIEMTLAGLRERIGAGPRIIALLEPRSNTMRQGAMKDKLASSLAGADYVFCLDLGTDWPIKEVLAPLGNTCQVCTAVDEIVRDAVAMSRPGDRLLVMSNGGFGDIHRKLLAGLAALVET